MIIPSVLVLEQRQIDKLLKWVDSLTPISIEEHDEAFGGASLTNRIEYRISDGSICTQITALDMITKRKCDLTIDDNNELMP